MDTRTRVHLCLLGIGLIGTLIMLYVSLSTDDVAASLGSARAANILSNSLVILELPVLLFFAILTVYAALELVKIYRRVNDPESYRRKRATKPNKEK